MVQNASESDRIRPDPAKTVKPRRISDHSRAEPVENSETQTHFGPPTCGAHRKTAKPRRVLDRPRPDSQWSPQELGRRKHSGRACARIGVGYGVLGQVINLPQWGLSCPSRWFRAPMLFVGFGRVPWWGWRPLGSLIGYGFGSVAGNGAACGGCGHAVGGFGQLTALPGAPREGTEAALVCASGAGGRSACPSGSVFHTGNTLPASV